jgi:DNA polymerase sigma
MPYSLGTDRLEKVDLSKVKSKLTEEEEQRLNADLLKLYKQLLPTKPIEGNRKKLVAKLEKLFNDKWPGRDIKVHLFGSSGNNTCSDDSDGR